MEPQTQQPQLTKKEQSDTLVKVILTQLQRINDYRIPIKFWQANSNNSQNQPLSLLTIGDVGNGKSTLNSWLMYKYLKEYTQIKFKSKLHKFKAQQSSESVTKEVEKKGEKGITIIDTPGTNDSDETLSNSTIGIKYIKFLKENQIIQKEGLSGLIQCVMLRASGRIEHSTVKAMSRLLLSYTYIYEDFDPSKAPRINVVFTDFSKFGNSNNKKKGNLPGDSDDEDEEDTNDTYSVDAQVQLGFDSLVQRYKEALISQIQQEYSSLPSKFISQRVNLLFKKENFYAFKDDLNDQNKADQEIGEVQRLIQDNIRHKQWKATNIEEQDEAHFEPVWLEIEQRDLIIDSIKKTVNFYEQELVKGHQNYIMVSGQEKCQIILDLIDQIKKIKENFLKMVKECPHILMKLPPDQLNFCLQESIQKFSLLAHDIFVQEISKYNSEMAMKLEQEKKNFEGKLKKQQEEIQKMGQRNLDLQNKLCNMEEDIKKKDQEFQIQKKQQESKLKELEERQEKNDRENEKLREQIRKDQEEHERQMERERKRNEERSSQINDLALISMLCVPEQPMFQPYGGMGMGMGGGGMSGMGYSGMGGGGMGQSGMSNSSSRVRKNNFNEPYSMTAGGRERNLICPVCSAAYAHQGHLSNHMAKHH